MASEMMDGFIAGKMDGGSGGGGMCMPVMPAYGYGMPWGMGGMGMGMGMGMGWGMGEWLPFLLIAGLLFGGGNGFGFGGGRSDCATQADVRSAVDQQTLISKLDQQTYGLADVFNSLNNMITSNFRGVDNAICTLGYQTQQGISGLSSQMAQCCCDIERGIDRNTTQGVFNTNAIQQQISSCCCEAEKMNLQSRFDAERANCGTLQAIDKLGDRIIGYLSNQETQNLRDEVQSYRLQASQQRQNQYLIDQLRPCPVPAYLTCNPYAASYGFGQNFGNAYGFGRNDGCGCGCAA